MKVSLALSEPPYNLYPIDEIYNKCNFKDFFKFKPVNLLL